MKHPEPVQQVKYRRDTALQTLVGAIPYAQFIGIRFERHGDELTAVLPFDESLIGNPILPALHGGVIASFLEVAAIVELSWAMLWKELESGRLSAESMAQNMPRLPKTIDFTIDFLRTGLPRDAYARARVNRSGRRYASVHVEAWQDNRTRLFAQATGHFLMPPAAENPSGKA
ncbi:PaaI family thioesterase [Roseinatronobacter alkalisoli]|uniref:PaaI family thioesterase n=1 Tax=Roseinatronobacter alkalisoli TaxID=3028235 RepID=A0ABT5T453_9RHOB|nr:PaaI family thioesterase [Roseinatronobacter sp. HJB301]MDD7969756.1 PaaI family thioesterase [Roseinatronobacter sp. HJB301]